MPHQVAVTVRAPLLDASQDAVQALLREVRSQGPHGALFPFARMPEIHFARLFVLEEVTDLDGRPIPASLVYMADVDEPAGRHLAALARVAGSGVDRLFGHCVGYPAGRPDPEPRLAWLQCHQLGSAAYYVHRVGRTVTQIRDEARLHDRIRDIIDHLAVPAGERSEPAIRRRVQQAVLDDGALAWAARRAPGPGLVHRLRESLLAVAVVCAVLVTLPLLLPVTVVWLLVVRLLEITDRVDSSSPDPAHVHEVEAFEDHGAQNPFTAVGLVKAGLVRRTTMAVALRGLDLACRIVYHRDNLAGIRSIHFARWLPIDGGRRAVFASSYDGSVESYMDDFIARVYWGVNLVFSNGVGYPRTRWLVGGGALDELTYKRHLRRHQVPTTVFYSAYETLPAPTIDANSRVRDGLGRALDADEAARWLAEL